MMYFIKITPEIMVAHHQNLCKEGPRSCQCQVAAALKEATGDDWIVGFTRATRCKDSIRVALPEEVTLNISKMDSSKGHSVQPFAFEVDIP